MVRKRSPKRPPHLMRFPDRSWSCQSATHKAGTPIARGADYAFERCPCHAFGAWRIAGTGVAAKWIADRAAAGDDDEMLAKDYGITVREVRAAIAFCGEEERRG